MQPYLQFHHWPDGAYAVCYAADRYIFGPSDCIFIVPGTLDCEEG